MKRHKIHYSKEAFRDLDEIWEYIASVLQNHSAADRTIDRILDAVDQLREFPEIDAPLSSVADIESDYRCESRVENKGNEGSGNTTKKM